MISECVESIDYSVSAVNADTHKIREVFICACVITAKSLSSYMGAYDGLSATFDWISMGGVRR